ncbi:MAG: Tetratricopeptide 2 repeat protein [Caulobacter sp.]|nr:Tetratricopeptide 2 repeat protein [Caulobacter sp.]
MCRMRALAATVLALTASSAPAWAADRAAPPAATAAVSAAPRKAGPTERLEAQRLDPLARAAFWAREVEADARDVQASLSLAQALRGLGRYDDAAAAAERVLVMSPDNEDALLESARAHLGGGQGFYAIEPARHAAALAPTDWRPVSLLGVAYEQAQRDDEALAAHRRAVALAPDQAAPAANLALYLAGHGDLAGAETLLRKAVTLPGASIQVRQNLALVVGLQGRLAEAEALARQDLPPESVDNNLAWLRAATSQAAPTRSWDALKVGG